MVNAQASDLATITHNLVRFVANKHSTRSSRVSGAAALVQDAVRLAKRVADRQVAWQDDQVHQVEIQTLRQLA